MKLSEIYIKDVVLKEFWGQVKEDTESDDNDEGIQPLLKIADEIIFKPFGVNTLDKVYFIAGSARLYLFPKLREAFELTGTIGDLDIVIPDRQFWENANLGDEFDKTGIYRPSEKYNIEVFSVWDPSKAGGQYKDVTVRSLDEILEDSDLIGNHYYMDLFDITDYKLKLNRVKEKKVVELINSYNNSDEEKFSFLKKIIKTIGLGDARRFFGGDASAGLLESFFTD